MASLTEQEQATTDGTVDERLDVRTTATATDDRRTGGPFFKIGVASAKPRRLPFSHAPRFLPPLGVKMRTGIMRPRDVAHVLGLFRVGCPICVSPPEGAPFLSYVRT